jgi:hypothetical protein
MSSQRVSGTAVQRTIAVLGSAVFFVVAPDRPRMGRRLWQNGLPDRDSE